jgi:flagellin
MYIEPVNSFRNLAAERVLTSLTESTVLLQKSLARLSSGLRILTPDDDPAGLAQAIKLDGRVTRADAVSANIDNAISFTDTQSGFLDSVTTALTRMSELTVLAQDTTKTATDISGYVTEFTELQNFVSDIGTKTFNSINLFGASGLAITIDSEAATFTMSPVNYTAAVASGGLSTIYTLASTQINTTTNAASAASSVTTAINNLSKMQAGVGANLQRLTLSQETLSVLSENLSAAVSRIMDVDLATETTAYARHTILVSSGTSMLAQAHATPENLLSLLQP